MRRTTGSTKPSTTAATRCSRSSSCLPRPIRITDMAVWDAVAKIEGKPLFTLLAERYGSGTPNPRVFVYAAGGYYWPGQGIEGLTREMRSYLDRGYTVVKKKIGGASLAEDCKR